MKSALTALWNTIYNWRELWFWPLVALIQLWLLIQLAWALTGRAPQESADHLVALGFNVLYLVIAISVVSIFKESASRWWKREDVIDRPHILWTEMIARVLVFAICVWAVKH
jgi:hypothetical protein